MRNCACAMPSAKKRKKFQVLKKTTVRWPSKSYYSTYNSIAGPRKNINCFSFIFLNHLFIKSNFWVREQHAARRVNFDNRHFIQIPRHLNSQLGIKSHPLFSCPAINALAARLFALEVGTREAVVICLLKRVLKTVAHFSDSLLAIVLYSRYG